MSIGSLVSAASLYNDISKNCFYMESIAGERTLDTFKTLHRASEYYKVNIVIFANGKVIPVESIVTSSGGIPVVIYFCFSVKENKEDLRACIHARY